MTAPSASYTLDDIGGVLPDGHQIVGSPAGRSFDGVRPANAADDRSLAWINPARDDKQEILDNTSAGFVVVDPSLDLRRVDGKVVIVVPNPKLTFAAILTRLYGKTAKTGVHASAVVDQEASLGANVYVGPFTYVGKAVIGDGTVIHGHCHVHDGVQIGRDVVIHAGCVLGAEGFSFERDADGSLHKFPHVGGVVIEDNVELQVMSDVDRGTLGDTIVRRGVKIDSFCHIGHNCDIGEHTLVAAQAMLGGSLRVGRRCWLGPATVFRDGLEIGDDAYVGLGALVVRDVASGERVMGSPAREIGAYKEQLRAIRQLTSGHEVTS